MPGPIQLIDVPFATGSSEKVDQRWQAVGSQYSVTNGIWAKQNAIDKRPGINTTNIPRAISTGGTANLCRRAYSYKNEVGFIDQTGVLEYTPNSHTALFRKDDISNCVATRSFITQGSSSAFDSDIAEGSGFRAVAWTSTTVGTNGNLYVTIYDATSGAVTYSGLVTGTVNRPRVFILDQATAGYFVIVVYQDNGANTIKAQAMNLIGANSWSAPTTLVTDCAANAAWDACPQADASAGITNRFYVAYESTVAGNTVKAKNFTVASGTISAGSTATVAAPGFALSGVGVRAGSTYCWVAYSYNGGGKVDAWVGNPSTMAQVTAPFTVQALAAFEFDKIGIEILGSSACITFGQDQGSNDAMFRWAYVSSGGTVTRGPMSAYNQQLLSRPFAVASPQDSPAYRVYCLVTWAGYAQGTQFLVELNVRTNGLSGQSHPVATIAPRQSYASTYSSNSRSKSTLSSINFPGSTSLTQYKTTALIAESTYANGRNGLAEVTFDFAHPAIGYGVEIGQSLFFAGGVPSFYDGTYVAEAGFLGAVDPAMIGFTKTAAAGGALQTGVTYSWIFVPEWHDSRGQLHRGQPSAPVNVAMGANTKVTFTIPQITLMTKDEEPMAQQGPPVYIIPYRTAYTGGAMSSVYYRVYQDIPPAALTRMDGVSATMTWVDLGSGATADATIVGNEPLYTTGGVLEADCPPSFSAVCLHKNRIYGVGDDGKTVWYSTEYSYGLVPRFNDTQTFSVDDGGAITALASMDDKLIIFKADRVFYCVGSGPNELGQNNDLSYPPVRLPTEVGCTDMRSVCLTPQGIVFRTAQDMALLDRGLQVNSNWGDPVEDDLATYNSVTSAMLHPTRPEVWFTCLIGSEATPTTGVTLVYNHLFGAWSKSSFYDSATSTDAAPMRTAIANGTSVYLCTTSGQLSTESSSSYIDSGNTWTTTTVETAWIKPAGIQGFATAYDVSMLMQSLDSHNLTLWLAFDYGSYAESRSWADSLGVNQYSAVPLTRRWEALRVKYVDARATGTSTGQGARLVGLTASVAQLAAGLNRLASTKRS